MLTLSLRSLVPGLRWKSSGLQRKSSGLQRKSSGLRWKSSLSKDWNPGSIMGNDVRGRENNSSTYYQNAMRLGCVNDITILTEIILSGLLVRTNSGWHLCLNCVQHDSKGAGGKRTTSRGIRSRCYKGRGMIYYYPNFAWNACFTIY